MDIPKEKTNFRGLNITPVIARAFERTVYQNCSQEAFEEQLNETQFADRKGGSCVDTLLKIQHFSFGNP